MPVPKTKKAADANGAANGSAKGKAASSSVTTDKKDTSEQVTPTTGGRPDKKVYDAEQEKIKAEIESLQTKLNAVRDKIGLATSQSGPGNERRNVLKAELDTIRNQQSGGKNSRSKTLDQLKALQESVQKKGKDLQAAKSKIPFKTVNDVDAHVRNLEKQVESGSMKLAEEKRALQEISSSKRYRRQLEGFQEHEAAIEADKQQMDALRAELDDPEAKALSERYDTIKVELDEIKKQGDEAYAGRSKLFSERDVLQTQINDLYSKKRELSQQYKDSNDRYWSKVHEDRARRQERFKAQRAAEALAKKKEIAQRLRDEAEIPAFQAEIEDCQTLIDFFSGKITGNVSFKSTAANLDGDKADLPGVPKLELRKVEEAPEGLVVLKKKKGEEEEAYFIASKGGKKGKKGGNTKPSTPAAGSGTSTPSLPSADAPLNMPLATLTALTSLSIPPPDSNADVPRLITDLSTKKSWYEANQARVTSENVAKAESEIQRLAQLDDNENENENENDIVEAGSPVSPTGPESPAEPAPTPAVGPAVGDEVPSEEVSVKLEAVQENENE